MKQQTKLGAPSEVKKVDGEQVCAWYGIRYATAKRFSAATPAFEQLKVSSQQEVPIFPQLPSRLAAVMGQGKANSQSEDAFFLNIWAPKEATGLPIVFFIHGGAWMTGGGAMSWYDGSRLAAQGLVVMTVNYRLGPLGHMGQADAHELPLPAADILLSLRWVADNVQQVGGDPYKITLMGQSAGGWYAHLLSVLSETKGLIHRVALHSMGTRTPWTPETQKATTHRADSSLNGKLQIAPVAEALKAGMAALHREPVQLAYGPAAFLPVASAALPKQLLEPEWAAQACHAEAVYLRCTADESSTFLFNVPEQYAASQEQVDDALGQWRLEDLPPELQFNGVFTGAKSGLSPYRQLVAASSWRQFQRFPSHYAGALIKQGRSVISTSFNVASPLERLHSGHCFDLPFQFGNLWAWQDAPMLAGYDADLFEVESRTLISEMADFAKGVPASQR